MSFETLKNKPTFWHTFPLPTNHLPGLMSQMWILDSGDHRGYVHVVGCLVSWGGSCFLANCLSLSSWASNSMKAEQKGSQPELCYAHWKAMWEGARKYRLVVEMLSGCYRILLFGEVVSVWKLASEPFFVSSLKFQAFWKLVGYVTFLCLFTKVSSFLKTYGLCLFSG